METVELRKFSFKAIIVSPQHTTVSTQHTEMAITTNILSYHVPTGQQAYKSTKPAMYLFMQLRKNYSEFHVAYKYGKYRSGCNFGDSFINMFHTPFYRSTLYTCSYIHVGKSCSCLYLLYNTVVCTCINIH